jgi:2-amino-4-hydroxy-6-hydroxymethyldihydropteridine diphosphokinase
MHQSVNSVYLVLGGNLGNRKKNLEIALRMIGVEIGIIQRLSGIYETEPWGFKDTGNFMNQVIEITTDLQPPEVLEKIKKIETYFGREMHEHIKYEPRRMDIDILFYNSEIIQLPDLNIPHPYLHERNFVLVPLNELAADFIHPLLKKSISQLKSECKDTKWTNAI